MAEMIVKLDAADLLAAVAKLLEPGSVLLSAEAVEKLAQYVGFNSAEDFADALTHCGAIFAQKNAHETFPEETLLKNEAGAGRNFPA